jgi:hypothetical protein
MELIEVICENLLKKFEGDFQMTRIDQKKFWEDAIGDYEASGMKMAGWCRERGIKPYQLRYWIGKGVLRKSVSPEPPVWISVNVDSSESEISKGQDMILRIGAVSIEVSSGFDPGLLADIVKVLMSL